jgi:hypothetical protein
MRRWPRPIVYLPAPTLSARSSRVAATHSECAGGTAARGPWGSTMQRTQLGLIEVLRRKVHVHRDDADVARQGARRRQHAGGIAGLSRRQQISRRRCHGSKGALVADCGRLWQWRGDKHAHVALAWQSALSPNQGTNQCFKWLVSPCVRTDKPRDCHSATPRHTCLAPFRVNQASNAVPRLSCRPRRSRSVSRELWRAAPPLTQR